MMRWVPLLLLAVLLEVAGTTCMKYSHGFTRLLPSVLLFALSVVAAQPTAMRPRAAIEQTRARFEIFMKGSLRWVDGRG